MDQRRRSSLEILYFSSKIKIKSQIEAVYVLFLLVSSTGLMQGFIYRERKI